MQTKRPGAAGRRAWALAGLACVVLGAAGCGRPAPPVPAANVVLILIDTLRADHLGTYGYGRPTSPTIDRLAAESLLFEQARSAAPWTNPSVASIFTGMRPDAVFRPKSRDAAIKSALPTGLPLLAEKLRAAGLRTAALIDHPGLSEALGYSRGFESFVHLFAATGPRLRQDASGEVVTGEFARALDRMGSSRFFLYLHLVYPHAPYAPPPPFDGMFGPTTLQTERAQRKKLVNAYDGEIRYADAVVGRLTGELERRELLDGSWLIVTADHGEGFWEHGRYAHGNSFFDELLRVPLIVRPPRRARFAPRRFPMPVSLVDLHATILEAAAGDRLGEGEWRRSSLLRFRLPGAARAPADVVSQQPLNGDVLGASLLRGNWKLVHRREPGRPSLRLYDVGADPGERIDRARQEAAMAEGMERDLRRYLAEDARTRALRPEPAEGVLGEDTVNALRALGYVN